MLYDHDGDIMFRSKDEKLRDFDCIKIGFVPKIVDEDYRSIVEKTAFIDYSRKSVKDYLESLPENLTEGLVERLDIENGTGIYETSSQSGLTVVFKPDYYRLTEDSVKLSRLALYSYSKSDCFVCPTIDVMFKPTDYSSANSIVRGGLDRFFLNQADIDSGTICAYGIKDGDIVLEDLKLLRRCLPRFTRIEARCNYDLGNYGFSYLV